MRRLLLIGLALALGASGWLHWSLFRTGPSHETEILVEPGTPAITILEDLHRRDLVPSVAAARLYLALKGPDRTFRFGAYRLAAGARPVDVLERILSGAVETVAVTVVEGLGATEIADAMAARGVGSAEGWARVLERADWIQDLAPGAPSLEGFLFPDTYRFAPATTAETAARHLVERFRQVWLEESSAVAQPWGSTLEIVTMASLVEAESGLDEERPVVSGVFVNRLGRGMLLQCDPTVVFALQRQGVWRGRLTRRDWRFDDPYNTYLYPGLPPGPINSPGRRALRAALSPAPTRYLYFVAKPEGGHAFSRTLGDHNRAVARLQRSRR